MVNVNPIRDGLRNLFVAAKAVISPTAEAELPYMRHTPLGSDEDNAAWKSDMDYLKALAADVYAELKDGAFLWEMPFPVEGVLFWDSYGEWPSDEAALLIDAWKVAA